MSTSGAPTGTSRVDPKRPLYQSIAEHWPPNGTLVFHELLTPSCAEVANIARRTAQRLHQAFRKQGRTSQWDHEAAFADSGETDAFQQRAAREAPGQRATAVRVARIAVRLSRVPSLSHAELTAEQSTWVRPGIATATGGVLEGQVLLQRRQRNLDERAEQRSLQSNHEDARLKPQSAERLFR